MAGCWGHKGSSRCRSQGRVPTLLSSTTHAYTALLMLVAGCELARGAPCPDRPPRCVHDVLLNLHSCINAPIGAPQPSRNAPLLAGASRAAQGPLQRPGASPGLPKRASHLAAPLREYQQPAPAAPAAAPLPPGRTPTPRPLWT